MIYKYKSVIIGRMQKDKDGNYPCFFHFFNVNNPHRKNIVPEKMIEFPHTHQVFFKNLSVYYLPDGNDLVMNNLKSLEIEKSGDHLYVSGKQNKEKE